MSQDTAPSTAGQADAPQPAATVINSPTTKAIESATEEIAPGVFRHTWTITIDTNPEPDPQV